LNFLIKQHLFKFTKFGLVGILCTLIDFILFISLIFIFELSIISSHLSAFSVAVLISYFLNKNYTFDSSLIKNNQKTITKYILLNTIGAVISTTALLLLSSLIHILIAKLFAAALSLLWNYTSSYFFIFSSKLQFQKK